MCVSTKKKGELTYSVLKMQFVILRLITVKSLLITVPSFSNSLKSLNVVIVMFSESRSYVSETKISVK